MKFSVEKWLKLSFTRKPNFHKRATKSIKIRSHTPHLVFYDLKFIYIKIKGLFGP